MLQWDRTSEGAEIHPQVSQDRCIILLQWDRTSEGAEMHEIDEAAVPIEIASMGPHLGRCGNRENPTPVRVFFPGFNGTAPRKVRKFFGKI